MCSEKSRIVLTSGTQKACGFFCSGGGGGGYSEQLNVGIRMTHTYLQCSGNETGEQIHPTSIATPLFLQNDFLHNEFLQ